MDILEIRMSVRVDRRRGRRPYRSTKNEERRQPTYEWIRGERESLLTTAITDIPILAQAADPMDNPTWTRILTAYPLMTAMSDIFIPFSFIIFFRLTHNSTTDHG